MNKVELKSLNKKVQTLKTAIAKSESNAESKREKIKTMQDELNELLKDIEKQKSELAQAEEELKKAEYSDALTLLDNAALSKLSKRQAEQLAQQILSGNLAALLGEEENDNNENKAVDTNING
ncbi:MAG: hypothetical protein IKH75_02105 [Ruminococcus sp.]|nr:hypothetical protein [Ruminococcus sp.]